MSLIGLSELMPHVQGVVPKVAAGIVPDATPEPVLGKQAARFEAGARAARNGPRALIATITAPVGAANTPGQRDRSRPYKNPSVIRLAESPENQRF